MASPVFDGQGRAGTRQANLLRCPPLAGSRMSLNPNPYEVGYSYDQAGRKATESLEIAGQTYTTTINYNELGQISGRKQTGQAS